MGLFFEEFKMSALKRFHYGNVTVFAGENSLFDFPVGRKEKLRNLLNDFIDLRGYRKIVDNYLRLIGNSGIGILCTHGCTVDNKWCFPVGDKSYIVQSWIDVEENNFGALIITSCNPDALSISSSKAVVIAPNGTPSISGDDYGRSQFEIFVPGYGYVNSYELNWVEGNLELRIINGFKRSL